MVQIMAWRRQGDKPLSEPMMASLLTHICVTRPQWVNRALICLSLSGCNLAIGLAVWAAYQLYFLSDLVFAWRLCTRLVCHCTGHSRNYMHVCASLLFCCGHIPLYFPISFRATSLALGQSYNCKLTHIPLDNMATISQTVFSDAFSWLKSFEFLLYARLKNGRIILWQCPSVCPSVRPSEFSGLFFIVLWDINLKLGICIQ